MLITDPNTTIGGMMAIASGGIIYLVKKIFFSPKGRRMVKDGIDHILEDKPVEGDPALIGLMARLMQQQENLLQAMANERASISDRALAEDHAKRVELNRQWDCIQKMTEEIGQLATGINSSVRLFEQTHRELATSIARVESNQVGLATWVYQKLGGGQPVWQPPSSWPITGQGNPPAQAQAR